MHTTDTLAAERCACGCDACGAAVPAGLDLARARDTELGLYHVQLVSAPVSSDDHAALAVVVTQRPHAMPADATITIASGRPRCRCTTPSELGVARRGVGRFETAAFSFQSPGWWVIRVTICGDAGWDAVTFNLAVP
jgi:hypothetical protein